MGRDLIPIQRFDKSEARTSFPVGTNDFSHNFPFRTDVLLLRTLRGFTDKYTAARYRHRKCIPPEFPTLKLCGKTCARERNPHFVTLSEPDHQAGIHNDFCNTAGGFVARLNGFFGS